MSTLQRSSVSFRRQGSSGRIWDNQLLHLHDPKAAAAGASENGRLGDVVGDRNAAYYSQPPSATAPGNTVHSLNSPPPRSESKAQTCGFSAIFRRCTGSHA